MLYFFYSKNDTKFKMAQVETWDGVVTKATPALAWAIGKKLSWLIENGLSNGLRWKLARDIERYPDLTSKCTSMVSSAEVFEGVML